MRLRAMFLAVLMGGLVFQPAFSRPKDRERGPQMPDTLVPGDRGHAAPQDAARRAQEMNGGGRVLSVDSAPGGHRVKLLKNGEVRIVFVPE